MSVVNGTAAVSIKEGLRTLKQGIAVVTVVIAKIE